MKTGLQKRNTPSTLLARLIETPNLVRTIQALPTQAFSGLIQHVGIEDAGEIVALATSEQIVAAFDEDLFTNTRPGERETFDVGRFVIWLEVLLEAGEAPAAKRISELSETFIVQALSSVVLVLDYDALRYRMAEGDSSAFYADKALESSLSEEIDGYLLVCKVNDGWDAVLSLILALDRDYRHLLVRLLDQCSAIAKEYIDDLDALTSVLSAEESLSEDVEAERESRRSRLGYVDPRAAKAFLTLSFEPLDSDIADLSRDHITNSYLRELEHRHMVVRKDSLLSEEPKHGNLLELVENVAPPLFALPGKTKESEDPALPFIEGMQLLAEDTFQRFNERLDELAYLGNVLAAGTDLNCRRMRPAEAAEAALMTVAFGAELVSRSRKPARSTNSVHTTATEMLDILHTYSCDILFRRACAMLHHRDDRDSTKFFLQSRSELKDAIDNL
jgi:hypothetical protein